ncbi:MAG: hypothetical protein ACPIOQ_49890 [Promethearchaeia archaeon]
MREDTESVCVHGVPEVLQYVTVHCFDFFEASGVGLGCGGDHFAGNVCC